MDYPNIKRIKNPHQNTLDFSFQQNDLFKDKIILFDIRTTSDGDYRYFTKCFSKCGARVFNTKEIHNQIIKSKEYLPHYIKKIKEKEYALECFVYVSVIRTGEKITEIIIPPFSWRNDSAALTLKLTYDQHFTVEYPTKRKLTRLDFNLMFENLLEYVQSTKKLEFLNALE